SHSRRRLHPAVPSLVSIAPARAACYSLSLHDALPISSEAEKTALSRFAHDVGLAFQMRDDLLDAEGVVRDTGKAVGKDKARGKRSEEHTSELQSRENLVCRLLLEKKNKTYKTPMSVSN